MNEVSLTEYSEQWRSINWKSVEKTVEKLQNPYYQDGIDFCLLLISLLAALTLRGFDKVRLN